MKQAKETPPSFYDLYSERFSDADLARALGCSKTFVFFLKKGKRSASPERIKQLSEILGLPENQINESILHTRKSLVGLSPKNVKINHWKDPLALGLLDPCTPRKTFRMLLDSLGIISFKEFTKRTGIYQSAISREFSSTKPMGIKTVARISRALNVSAINVVDAMDYSKQLRQARLLNRKGYPVSVEEFKDDFRSKKNREWTYKI